jgi:hypothetical protein
VPAPDQRRIQKALERIQKATFCTGDQAGTEPAVTLYNPHNTAVVEHKGLSDASVSYLV